MARRDTVIIARLSLLITCILGVVLILIFAGCSNAPSRTRPDNMPYPTTLGPQMPGGLVGINEARCLGGGIGGCTLGGKAEGGPVN